MFGTRAPSRFGPLLAGTLVVLLGVGLVPALAPPGTAAEPAAAAGARRATTTLVGFDATPATVQAGGTVIDPVSVRPRERRAVRVQARRPGSATFVTVSSGRTSATGAFRAAYHPTTVGRWRFRLLLPATAQAAALVSRSRLVTATPDTTPPAPVTALSASPGIGTAVSLSWTLPSSPDLAGVMIRRQVGTTAPATPADGVLVARTTRTATSFVDTGLAAATTYGYALFAFDTSGNSSRPARRVVTTGAATTAVLSLNGSTGATAKQTVNLSESFDVSASHPGRGLSLVSGTLDYGDGTTETFSGDPATWQPTPHLYDTVRTVTVRWTVVDSAQHSDSASIVVQVFDEPTATISLATAGPFEKNQPVGFVITSNTPAGTTFTDFDTFSLDGVGTVADFTAGAGAPPATLDLVFATPGTYTVFVDGFNDAGGLATASVDVVITDVPQP